MKVTKQELINLIKEELDALFSEGVFDVGTDKSGKLIQPTDITRAGTGTGGGGRRLPVGMTDTPSGFAPAQKPWENPHLTQVYVPPDHFKSGGEKSKAVARMFPTYQGGWVKRPVSKSGGKPIEHPGIYIPGGRATDPLTGRATGAKQLPGIAPPLDPIENPEDFPLPADETEKAKKPDKTKKTKKTKKPEKVQKVQKVQKVKKVKKEPKVQKPIDIETLKRILADD